MLANASSLHTYKTHDYFITVNGSNVLYTKGNQSLTVPFHPTGNEGRRLLQGGQPIAKIILDKFITDGRFLAS